MNDPNAYELGGGSLGGETTGKVLVLTDGPITTARDLKRVNKGLTDLAGVELTSSREFDSLDCGEAVTALTGPDTSVLLAELGVAVVAVDHEQRERVLAGSVEHVGQVLAAEPERRVRVLDGDYLDGYQDGVDGLVDSLRARERGDGGGAGSAAVFEDDDLYTWGLKAVGVPTAATSGSGSRVAVLDTGVDTDHPDLVGRVAGTASFIDGESVEDGNGHGTHCIGTVAGSIAPASGPRYGVAPSAEILAAKVLSDAGSGADGGILAGIQWAIGQRCQIVSMSLGSPVSPSTPYSTVYETVAIRARTLGTLIIAAAGNSSRRDAGQIAPVGNPANCPSILSVAAVDNGERIASFSSGTVPPGGQIDVAGPGVAVLSAAVGGGTRRLNGTSMATPHAAGVAAVILSSREGGAMTADELTARLFASARRLRLGSTDAGAGLVTAPQR